MNFPFQRIQQATNIFGGLSSGTPSTPGMPLTTSPYLAGAQGIASLGKIGSPLSNVIGSVVQGAGNILGDIFGRGNQTGNQTPPIFYPGDDIYNSDSGGGLSFGGYY
jgi:hypothetical protein